MDRIAFSVLRGICQIPAYIAHSEGYLRDVGIDSEMHVEPTAWMVPRKFESGDCDFAVIPWTRVAASTSSATPLVVLCGAGHEEAALVVRRGIEPSQIRKLAVPLRGGMKDLTAMALIEGLGLDDPELVRQPSGDGAIISLFAQGSDAASMVEPYATAMEQLGVGTVVRRTGDVWKGAPGCSLCCRRDRIGEDPELVQRVVSAFVRGAAFAQEHPDEAVCVAARTIGISEEFIRKALDHNHPDVCAIQNEQAVAQILQLMLRLGYLEDEPRGFLDLRFLNQALVS
ncbi:MAG: ABC transporter substrate-binding protein [Candidatus Eisenbacteria bacterium]